MYLYFSYSKRSEGSSVQVAASIDSERTRRREVESLEAAMRQTKLTHGLIVNLRASSEIQLDAGTIRIVPAWRWALERPMLGHRSTST